MSRSLVKLNDVNKRRRHTKLDDRNTVKQIAEHARKYLAKYQHIAHAALSVLTSGPALSKTLMLQHPYRRHTYIVVVDSIAFGTVQ